jgi:hypothetical protein
MFFLCSTGILRADIYTYSETLANFGTLSQLSGSVTPPAGQDPTAYRGNACAPTAVANSLIFLNNTFNVPNLIMGGGGYATLNSLAGFMGTTTNGTIVNNNIGSGTTTYLGATGQNVTPPVTMLGGQISSNFWGNPANPFTQGTPLALNLYNGLTNNYGIDFTLSWWNGTNFDGAHELTLTGINYNTALGNGAGTLSFVDPIGGVKLTGSVTNLGFGLYLTYTGGGAGNPGDLDNPAQYGSGIISADMLIAVPEPASLTLLLMGGFVAVIVWRQRKMRWVRDAVNPSKAENPETGT